MSRFLKISIRFKLFLLAIVSVLVALLTTCLGFVYYDVQALRTAKIEQLSAQSRMLAFNTTGVLTFQDEEAAEQLLLGLSNEPAIEHGCLCLTDGTILAKYDKT